MRSMPARPRRAALFVGWIVSLVLAASLPPLTSAAAAASVNPDGVGSVVMFGAGLAVNTALAVTIGLILLLRVPGNRVGSLLYASGPLLASIGVGWAATYLFGASGGPSDVRAGLAGLWTGIVSPIAFFVAFTAVGIFFPDGRLPMPSWNQPFRALVAGFAVSSVLFVIAPWPAEVDDPLNPLALPGVPVEVSQLATAMSTISLIGSFVLARHRRSSAGAAREESSVPR